MLVEKLKLFTVLVRPNLGLQPPQIQGLAVGNQDCGQHLLEDVQGLAGLTSRQQGQRVHRLVVHLGGHHVTSDRSGQQVQFALVAGHGDVSSL